MSHKQYTLKELKGKKCSQVCATWNRDDKDCEVFGSYHPSPSKCWLFKKQGYIKE